MIPERVCPEIQSCTTRFFHVCRPPWLESPLSDRRVCFDAYYTLRKPCFQIGLAIPHTIAANLHKWNFPPLASPLGERLDREPRDSCHVVCGKQRSHGRGMSRHLDGFWCACHF